MATQTGGKNTGNAGKGRVKGVPNKSTVIKQNVADIFKTFMGIDDQAVEETGQISGQGLKVRERFLKIAAGERTPDPAYTNFMRFVMAYAYGTPIKMQPQTTRTQTLSFITAFVGPPWEHDPLAQREKEMLAAQAADEIRDAEQRALEAAGPVPEEDDDMTLVPR